jgi:GcrA cell cycle regulator
MSIDTWTPERVEQLQGFVVAGLSCSQIAAQIGVTRNAVIGKIHRLGLSPVRPPGAMARSCPPRARDPRAASPRRRLRLLWSDGAATPEVEGMPTAVESAEPCSLLDLAQGKCRWPVSDTGGGTADFVFCGNAVIEGLSYCAGHARMAYRQLARRRA